MRSVLKKSVGLTLVLLAAWQLIAGAEVSAQGVRESLGICGNVLIPSMFPFMVLAALLPATAAGRLASAPFGLVGRLFYRLPQRCAPVVLMSWIGGYPAGARTLRELVDRGELTPQNAGKALCCCVNSSPAFLVTVVGAGILGSPLLGLQLFGCQLAAGAITGSLLLGRDGVGKLPELSHGQARDQPFSQALVNAVTSATAAMLSVCAFVLLLGAATALLTESGLSGWLAAVVEWMTLGWIPADAAAALVDGALEICGGCARATGLVPGDALKVLPFLLSFGGASVICQVIATLGGRGVPMRLFLISRPIHGLLTALLAYPLLRESCGAVQTGLMTAPALYGDEKTVLGTVLLLACCALLCLTVEGGQKEKAANQ